MSKLYTIKEIAKIINATPASVYSYLMTKKINFYKIGKLTRIKEEDFLKYLNEIKKQK